MKEKHLKLRVSGGQRQQRQQAREVVGWRMAERAQQESLLLGDVLDLAFTVDYNTHPDFGGVQLTLADFARHVPSHLGVVPRSHLLYSRAYRGDSIHHRWKLPSKQVCSSCGNPYCRTASSASSAATF